MREGNDEADRLTKPSKDMDAVDELAELLKGYVLWNKGGIAQGGYREWIIENPTNN